MKLSTVRTPLGEAIGVVDPGAGTIVVLDPTVGDVSDIITGQLTLTEIEEMTQTGQRMPLDTANLAPPMRRFTRDVLCTGWNYVDHFYESVGLREGQEPDAPPEHPTFFSRSPGSAVGPKDSVAYDPALSVQWDYEAELAMVIGRGGRSIPEDSALEHVFGYCVANDVSLRDVQRAHGGQWLKGKSIDATLPIGPWITTADEVADPAALTIECLLNSQLVQLASTADMAFSLGRIIAELSLGMTLTPGDVILTGTPSGIGNARTPKLFLRDGDHLVTRISGLGELDNRIAYINLTKPVSGEPATQPA